MENKKVIIGGTFEFLHKGHKALLIKAFSLGSVKVCLTSDEMVKRTKQRKVGGFFERKRTLEDFIINKLKREADIVATNDAFGPTLEEDFDYIVVSPETEDGVSAINGKRRGLSKNPIEIVKIGFVLAEDGKPISSTRIAKGEIDEEGRLLKN
jgi:pantetheine-phosphate adenylyltransferase